MIISFSSILFFNPNSKKIFLTGVKRLHESLVTDQNDAHVCIYMYAYTDIYAYISQNSFSKESRCPRTGIIALRSTDCTRFYLFTRDAFCETFKREAKEKNKAEVKFLFNRYLFCILFGGGGANVWIVFPLT